MVIFEHYFVDGIYKVTSEKEIEELAKHISKKVEMDIVSGPYTFKGKAGNEGYTTLVGIEFSSITIHHFEAEGKHYIYVDLLTCKSTTMEKVLEAVKEFGVKPIRWGSNIRNLGE
jgi:hypothetical protein